MILSSRLTTSQIAAVITEELRKIRYVSNVVVTESSIDPEQDVFIYNAMVETEFNVTFLVEVSADG